MQTVENGVPVPWLDKVAVPAWVTDSAQVIVMANARARELLGSAERGCLGRPCSPIVAARDEGGAIVCGEGCRVLLLARHGRGVPPVRVQVGPGRRWVWMFTIPVGDEPWIVHCAIDAELARRVEDYVRRLARRSSFEPAHPRRLTRRQHEVLTCLAADYDLPAIARRLFISHATVRNHVQHILEKLGVHSVAEAVALHLLGSGER